MLPNTHVDRAKEFAQRISFENVGHPYKEQTRRKSFSDASSEPLKAYRVVLGGAYIGCTYQTYHAVHRKAGRLISSTRYVLRWAYSIEPSFPSVRQYVLYHDTRTKAAVEMIENMLSAGARFSDTSRRSSRNV
jgi:hypothetical protein